MKLSPALERELLLVKVGKPEIFNPEVYEEIKRWFDTCNSCVAFDLPPISKYGVYPSCVEIVDGTLWVSFNRVIDLTTPNQ